MPDKKILVVEPDADFMELLKEAFEGLPCSFIHVADPNDAVMMFAVEGPDFVMISMDLPGVDPVTTLKSIREFDEKMPIVVLSKRYTKEMIIGAKQAKAADILVKPPDFKRLRSRVSGFLWTEEELGVLESGEELPEEEEPEEEFVEAIPKGAEVLNVNELVAGMRVARTLVHSEVVYADKGEVLTENKINHLNRMGVPEACVYIDPKIKKKSAKDKMPTFSPRGLPGAGGGSEKVFSKVKRSQIRIKVAIRGKAYLPKPDGGMEEIDIEVEDLSGGGAAILSKVKFDKDNEITLNFKLDDQMEFKDAKALVRHSTRRGTDENPFRTGIYFTSVTEKFREDLITHLFKIQQEQRKKEAERREDIKARKRRN
ncbi:MAG: response regulator [bacterium]